MTRRNLLASVAALVFTGAAFARIAFAAPIHVFGSGSQYGTVDSVTGAYTGIGRLTDSFNGQSIPLSGFAFGADANLYGVTGIDGAGENNEGNYLWRFNPQTGVSTDRRTLAVSLVTLARRPSDGELFGYTTGTDGTANLYRFNTATFAPVLVGSTGIATFGALTFDDTDRLYLADSTSGDLYRVDPQTAQATFFTATGVPNVPAMAVAEGSLRLYSSDNRARYRVSLQTGDTTPDGTYNIGGAPGSDLIYGAAIAPAVVPEGGTLWLLLGAVPLLRRRRK